MSACSVWARHVAVLALFVAWFAANGQSHGGGPGGPRGGFGGPGPNDGSSSHGPFGGGPPGGRSDPTDRRSNDGALNRGRLQLGPPGRWWDDEQFARTIGIDPTQQRRMDDVFSANRDTLVRLYRSLQHEEEELTRLVRARDLSEPRILDQIDRITQARGDLEKANAHMLLQLRKELSADQTARLQRDFGGG